MAITQFCSWRWLLLTSVCLASLSSVHGKRTICVRQKSYLGVTIQGGMEAGNFLNKGTAMDINDCLNMACDSEEGNIAFFYSGTCFVLKCYDIRFCELTVDDSGNNAAGAVYRIIEAYPVFKNAPDVVFVPEDTHSGKEIIHLEVVAESRITKRETMSFKIEKGNDDETFRLYPKSSNRRVSVRLQKLVDRENIASYQLTINATNIVENVSTLFNITIDVTDINDNPPVFLKSLFVFDVFSNISVGTTIGQLVAQDKDIGRNAKLSYTMTPDPVTLSPVTLNIVSLDPTTGKVVLKRKLRLDTVKSFDYQVTASDGFYKTTSRLKVMAYPNNINRPAFDKQTYEVRLDGQVPTDTEVVRVSANDSDFGKLGELIFQLTKGNEDSTFYITGEGAIKTRNIIPPQSHVYNLTVNVHDNGYPELYALEPVHVVILVQRLRFEQNIYETAVREDRRTTDEVLTVSATFWDGGTELVAGQQQRTQRGVHYYLDDVQDMDKFEMGERTGVITLKKSLDYENRKVHELEVRADYERSDSRSRRTILSANAILRLQVLDVNDNAPRFSRLFYSYDVWKSSKENFPVFRINATDADGGDNGRIWFDVLSGNINNTFVFQSDGMIYLRKSLKQTRLSTFNITVAAWDQGTPALRSASTAVVSIRVQGDGSHNAPEFDQGSYSAMISEGVPINTRILRVKADVYQGRSRVTYWIRNGGQKMPFHVDPNTGWIRTAQRLDREERNVYVLTIVASKDVLDRMSLSTKVNITITLEDENDNRPIFARDYYSRILSSPKVGTRIAVIKATDKDVGRNARILYKITRSHDEKYFTINSRTGLITTKRSLPTKSLIVLKCFVSARDEGKPSLTALNHIPVVVLMSSTFPITVQQLKRTTSQILLRFTMSNVSLEDVSHIGVVVQEVDSISDYDEITKRPLKSWFYIHNKKGNGVYAQRYLSGKVQCNDLIQKTKTFQFNVGADGNKCQKVKTTFCSGKLQADKKYRFQLVAYFKNDTSPTNVSFVESNMSLALETGHVNNAKHSAGFRSMHYDIVVMVVGIIVGLIILATVIRAIMLYRRGRYRLKKDEAKDGISYPLSNPRYHRAGENTPSSRSTLSFTEPTKSKKNDRRSEKVSPNETEKLEIVQDESGGVSRDSGCGVSVKSSNSDLNQRRASPIRKALFSFGKKNEDEEQEPEEKEMETELNT